MKYKVLITAPYFQPVITKFQHIFDENDIQIIAPPVKERFSEEQLLQVIEDIDGVIGGDDQFTQKVLQKAKKLKVISKWGTGIDSIDLITCKKLGIAVRNTPNAFSEAVADSVIGYVLCFARQIPWMDKEMREGRWRKIPSRTLRECTLGVIGVGNVGKVVVRRALGFGMMVIGNDIIEMPEDFLKSTGLRMVAKDELLEQADFISMNCDLNPTSFHLLDDRDFNLMKSTAIVMNTARGPVIHEQALVRALETKRIAGAALDVFEDEPLHGESSLLQMSNVLLAPHNANSSPAAWERVHQNTVKNLLEELKRSKR
jgi:D-3-phosphoglycerate dehydrogenase